MGCPYYFWNCEYCCQIKRNRDGIGRVSEDVYRKYCRDYDYRDCPIYKGQNDSSSGGCFLTSACVEAKGLPDDCHELTTLRAFRDGYMKNLPEGQADICEYYHTAPAIVEKIKALPNAKEIFDRIYTELVLPCVELIESGKNEEAYVVYRDYTKTLQKLYI